MLRYAHSGAPVSVILPLVSDTRFSATTEPMPTPPSSTPFHLQVSIHHHNHPKPQTPSAKDMHIIIVGAGITGLATAISLRRSAAHTVTIYEQSSLTNEVGAAINVPPNVARFLIPWGLDPVKSRFVKTPGMYFMSYRTLEQLEGGTFDHTGNEERYGEGLYYAHRVDLHEALRGLVFEGEGKGEGVVRLEKGKRVVGYVSG